MATKKKALKKSKLRHAEYYDFQKIQESLKYSVAICLIVVYTPVIIQDYPIIKKGGGSREP